MEEFTRRYPIGIQNFEDLRNNDCVYIDKTELIYRLTHTNKIYFLSRPRRFGKSLLISTLEAYFQGKKELFKGLAMDRLEKEWELYPIFHMDFSVSKYLDAFSLKAAINRQLLIWEELYGRMEGEETFSLRFEGVIQRAYRQTGKQVVILVDEYDSPMLDSNGNEALQAELRDIMRDFFSPLKKNSQYLRFLFLTGISKFSQMSIFSELNNLQNISMSDDYSAICGITDKELHTQMKIDIEKIAQANGESYEEACAHLKRQYDGYHFSECSEHIYNPFSLINAFAQRKYSNFWFSTGTPTFLIELLVKMNFNIRYLESMEVKEEDFDKATDRLADPVPVLYQSGYLTIKEYDPLFRIYTLGYPNEEVRVGFLETLIPSYLNQPTRESNFYIVTFLKDLMKGDIESCMLRTQAFFASIPNDLENKTEKHYQTIFYLIFRLMGQYVDTEVKSAAGRADVVVKLQDVIYVFVFKMDGSAEEALAQINSKSYAIPYQTEHRRVVKIGVNFDSITRTIGDWVIEG